jgi:hypothetical protein
MAATLTNQVSSLLQANSDEVLAITNCPRPRVYSKCIQLKLRSADGKRFIQKQRIGSKKSFFLHFLAQIEPIIQMFFVILHRF